MLTLKEKQFLFAELEALLVQEMIRRGFHPVKGYCYRCVDCKVGKPNSLHKLCLASDIELHDADGNYLTETEDHKQFGIFWESLHPLCVWGGRFKGDGDGNHYSIYYNGRA